MNKFIIALIITSGISISSIKALDLKSYHNEGLADYLFELSGDIASKDKEIDFLTVEHNNLKTSAGRKVGISTRIASLKKNRDENIAKLKSSLNEAQRRLDEFDRTNKSGSFEVVTKKFEELGLDELNAALREIIVSRSDLITSSPAASTARG